MPDTKTEETKTAPKTEFAQPRRKGQLRDVQIEPSEIPAPEIANEDFSPQAFAAVNIFNEEGEATGEFYIDEQKAKWLWFARPGGQIPARPSYTVKAMHKDGRLTQIPFEPQINNTAAGDLSDAIGLTRARRKGLHVFIDWDTMLPVYCPASDCWAMGNAKWQGFCSPQHANRTLPNTFNEAGEVLQGLMSRNATTSRVWGT